MQKLVLIRKKLNKLLDDNRRVYGSIFSPATHSHWNGAHILMLCVWSVISAVIEMVMDWRQPGPFLKTKIKSRAEILT